MTIADVVQMKPRKLARLLVSPHAILELLRLPEGGTTIGTTHYDYGDGALPADAKAVSVGIDEHGNVALVVESNVYDEVKEGGPMPTVALEYKVTHHGS